MSLFDLIVGALAVARLTTLVTHDTITKPIRDTAEERWVEGDRYRDWWWYELISCPWCVSVWIGAGMLGWWAVHRPSWLAVSIVAVWSLTAGTTAKLTR